MDRAWLTKVEFSVLAGLPCLTFGKKIPSVINYPELGNHQVPSIYYVSKNLEFSDPPNQYVIINTVLNIRKICHFLDPPTQTFCWLNIWMVPQLYRPLRTWMNLTCWWVLCVVPSAWKQLPATKGIIQIVCLQIGKRSFDFPAKKNKTVKLTDHTCACNSLTNFEYEAYAIIGNGNFVNLLNIVGKICEIKFFLNFFWKI